MQYYAMIAAIWRSEALKYAVLLTKMIQIDKY